MPNEEIVERGKAALVYKLTVSLLSVDWLVFYFVGQLSVYFALTDFSVLSSAFQVWTDCYSVDLSLFCYCLS